MATLNLCGFEAGDLSEAHASAGSPAIATTPVRTGQYALRCNPASGVAMWAALAGYGANGASALITRTAEAFYTFYFRLAALPSSGTSRIACVETNSGSPVVRINVSSTGVVNAQGATSSSDVATVTIDTWYRADLRVTSNGTSGLAIDGGTEQTCTANNLNQDRFTLGRFSTDANSLDCYYDDVLISDSGFPGAGQVVRLDPDGDGTYTGWAGGSGTTFAEVDDDVPGHDSDTTYIQCAGTDDDTARTFTLESSASAGVVGTILAVKTYAVCRTESTTSSSTVGMRSRNGTTDVDTSGQEWTTTYATKGQILATDPNGGGAWTSGGLDTLQVGVFAGTIAQAQRCTKVAAFVWSDGVSGGATEQGEATASQTQSATTAATLTAAGAAAASQAQSATSAATLTASAAATAAQAQVATSAATLTAPVSATATQAQAATSAGLVTRPGAASASQGQSATTTVLITRPGVATASQGQSATSAATLTAAASATAAHGLAATSAAALSAVASATACQAQAATSAATATLQATASASQDQVATTRAGGQVHQGAASASQGQAATSTGTLTASVSASATQAQAATAAAQVLAAAVSSAVQAQSTTSAGRLIAAAAATGTQGQLATTAGTSSSAVSYGAYSLSEALTSIYTLSELAAGALFTLTESPAGGVFTLTEEVLE